MVTQKTKQKVLPEYLRPRDLEQLGLPRHKLKNLIESGEFEKVARGIYRSTRSSISEYDSIAQVCKIVPHGVVCLLTALRFHEVGTQSPRKIWIAIDRKARKPAAFNIPVEIVRFSGDLLRNGVEEHTIMGVRCKITSPARTIVDCFRYRRKIGIDVAIEALRDGINSRKASVREILALAKATRIFSVITPYVEAMV